MSAHADPTAERSAPDGDEPASTVWQSLAGYRLLRTIGRGTRGVIYLASDGADEVAVKAVDDGVDDESFVAETECLASMTSPHVVRLLDVSVVADRPRCLVLERLAGPTLAGLVDDRGTMEAGEAVTLVVSILRGVRAVHSAGWVHGALSLSAVRLDASGRPVLVGFGRAKRSTPVSLRNDWLGVADVADAVLGRVDVADPQRLTRCREAVRAIGSVDDDEPAAVGRAQRELFALGPAAPVGTSRATVASAASVGRVRPAPIDATTAPVGFGRDPDARESSSPHERTRRRHATTGVAAAALALMEHGVGATIGARVRSFARTRRRALVLGAGAAAAVTVGALLVLPPGGSPGHAEPGTSDEPRRSLAESTPVPSRSPRAPAKGASPDTDAAGSTADRVGAAKVPSDDPVTAAASLLTLRSECLQRADAEGLAEVEQAGSPILAADTALVAAGSHTAPVPSASQLSLAETLGDAAVIAIAGEQSAETKPASVLLIRTDAGWRLRALFEN
ncbi:MAG: protein kinase domain-containing protein [Humibacter sp.]